MNVKPILPRHHVILHLTGLSRHEILVALATPLLADNLITDMTQFILDVEQRESEITTQVEDWLAIPHARSNAVRRLAMAVGIADQPGLVFNREASSCCRLFFLIGVPSYAPTSHLPLLQLLAHLSREEKRKQRLFMSKTPGQVVRCLSTYKG